MVSRVDMNACDYDTVVVGAGPAGCMAALEAAERGRVLLVDSSAIPRDKSCGGMLNEYAQEFLASYGELPADLIREPRHVWFRYVDWDRGIRKPTELRFLNVDRVGFDEWLLGRLPASVKLAPSTTLVGFNQDDSGVDVALKDSAGQHIVRCENLVGADGARSTVRRRLGIGSVATYVTLQDFCRLEDELEPYFDCIYLRDIGDSFAYAYVVPKGDVAIVGSVFYPKTKRPHEKQDAVLAMLRTRLPALGETVKREACVALSVRSAEDVVAGIGRVLLAGEAGGFMSPTSGEGISYAMNSGRLAGAAIAGSSPKEALAAYRASSSHIARNIRRKLRWLPFMESSAGKYLAGYVPTAVVSRVTKGL
jgi:flavin-dependent dehydrogenase